MGLPVLDLGRFGDRQLQKGGVFLLGRLVDMGPRGVSVRRLGGDRVGEIRVTRFLRNPAVTTIEMVGETAARTALRCAGRHVLAIQDTSAVRPDAHRGTGLFLHAVLGMDADDGTLLGLVDATILERAPQPRTAAAQAANKAKRRVTPFADKESARLLRGTQAAARIGAQAARVTLIADRESDVFELFAQCPDRVDLLVRAKHDRALARAVAACSPRSTRSPRPAGPRSTCRLSPTAAPARQSWQSAGARSS